jgi:hypothetical protein
MKSKALIALFAVAVPLTAVDAQTTPSATPTPIVTATPLPPVTPSPTPSAVAEHPQYVPCNVVFESASAPTSPGGPSALHDREYYLHSYAIKEAVGGSRFVYALGLPSMAADMNNAVSSKIAFLKITFTCPSTSISVANAVVSSAAPAGSSESFTVVLPGAKLPPHLPTPPKPVNPHPM